MEAANTLKLSFGKPGKMCVAVQPNVQVSNCAAYPAADFLVNPLVASEIDPFNQLVLEYQDMVFRQAYWMLGDADAAADAAQEAFIRAYQKRSLFNGGPFRPWIMRIVTNYCLDVLRSQKSRPTTSLELFTSSDEEIEDPYWMSDPDGSPEDMFERSQVQDLITRGIAALPADYRAVIIMVDLQRMDYEEVTAILGVPLGTMKSRLSRARIQLRGILQLLGM